MWKVIGLLSLCSYSFALTSTAANLKTLPTEILLPIQQCPSGFEIIGKTCNRLTTTEHVMDCPMGTRLTNKSCLRLELFDADIVCPPDSTRYDHYQKCVTTTYATVDISCLPDFTFDGAKCSKVSEYDVSHICDEGFQLSEKGVCFRKSIIAANSACPEGFKAERKGCVAYEKAFLVASCPDGGFLQGDECLSRDVRKPKGICKQGYVYEDGKCVKRDIASALPTCKEGELVGNRCVEIISDIPTATCRKGFAVSNGKCTKVIQEAIRMVCKRGYRLEGERCLSKTVKKPALLCEEGFELSDGRCVAVITGVVEKVCEGDSVLVNGNCVSRTSKPADMICPIGFTISYGECKKIVYADAKLSCPAGSNLFEADDSSSSGCLEYETRASIPVCKRGELGYHGKCVDPQQSDKFLSCPWGFSINAENEKCEKRVYKSGEIVCSNGGVLNRHNRCEKEVAIPPAVRCPIGFTIKGYTCTKIEEVQLIYKCPKGFKLIHNLCLPSHPRVKPRSAFKLQGSSKSSPLSFSRVHPFNLATAVHV